MVRIVDLGDKIRDGKLKLVRPEPPCLVCRRQAVVRAKEHKNVRGLADKQIPGLQEGRCERRTLKAKRVVPAAVRFPGHVAIGNARNLQGEPDELAAALNTRPIIKLIRGHAQ